VTHSVLDVRRDEVEDAVTTAFRISRKDLLWLDRQAVSEGRNRSELIREAIYVLKAIRLVEAAQGQKTLA